MKDQVQVFNEIRSASQSFPGATEVARIDAYFRQNPQKYDEYLAAPQPKPRPARQGKPAARTGLAARLVEDRIAALRRSDPDLGYEAAVSAVFTEHPAMYESYRDEATQPDRREAIRGV